MDDALELHADRTRGLEASDPEGRNLVMSCGTALHHALVAARALGWAPVVDTLPDPRDPDLLARIRLRPGGGPGGCSAVVDGYRGALHGSTSLHVVADPRRAPAASSRR